MLQVIKCCSICSVYYKYFLCCADDGGNVNAQNADGVTPLHDAVQRKQADVINVLLANNADVSSAAHSGSVNRLQYNH